MSEMTETRKAQMRARIHNLANFGDNICDGFQHDDTRMVSCGKCGYTSDVHDLRDALVEIERLEEENERLTKEAVDFGTVWHHAAKEAANEMRCRVANQDAVRHQAERADTAEAALAARDAEVARLTEELHAAKENAVVQMSRVDIAHLKAHGETKAALATLREKVKAYRERLRTAHIEAEGKRQDAITTGAFIPTASAWMCVTDMLIEAVGYMDALGLPDTEAK